MPRHLERLEWTPRPGVDLDAWPFTVPVVRQLIEAGHLEVPAGVTVLLGENGSGKSTLLEALAAAYPRLGVAESVLGATTIASPLRWHVRARTHPLASPAGFFLRAETLRNELEGVVAGQARSGWDGAVLDRSHGETFLEVLRQRFVEPGFYLLDEPEAALSFTGCLALLTVLSEIADAGCQAVVATHSPVVAALPGATLWQLGDAGIEPVAWEDAETVRLWRGFLASPEVFLRHL